MSCRKSAMPAPPSTMSARTRNRNCLRFMPSTPSRCAAASRGLRRLPAHAADREHEPGERDEQRNEADIENLRPEFQLVAVDPQVLAQLLQVAARFGRLLAEVLELGQLLRGQHRAFSAALRLLQCLRLFGRVVEAVLELLDLAEIALLRAVLHLLDYGERPAERGAAAQAHERVVPGKLLHQPLREGEIAVARNDHALAE